MKASIILAAVATIAISLVAGNAFAQQPTSNAYRSRSMMQLASHRSMGSQAKKQVVYTAINHNDANVLQAAQLAVSLHSIKSGVDCRLVQVIGAKKQTNSTNVALQLQVNERGSTRNVVAVVNKNENSLFTLSLWK